jgi:hypothetical protein
MVIQIYILNKQNYNPESFNSYAFIPANFHLVSLKITSQQLLLSLPADYQNLEKGSLIWYPMNSQVLQHLYLPDL